jgi:hypothetical protein
MSHDSTQDTLNHIAKVEGYLSLIADWLRIRGAQHDASKLQSPEKEIFDVVTPKLSALEYGSEAYKQALTDIKPALDHHYQNNSHHPEHWPNGVNDMSLLDIIEMLCDWKAAGERHRTGNIETSLRYNTNRFAIDEQLSAILRNTAKELGWIE